MNTEKKLEILLNDSLYQELVYAYGMNEFYEGITTNPVIQLIKRLNISEFQELESNPLFNLQRISNLAIICQSIIFDYTGGPDSDSELKMLRRHWYRFYKVEFAQPLSKLRGEDTNDSAWESRWSGRLSQSYAAFVDSYNLTYRDLWVEDGSRMIQSVDTRLFADCHILFCVEKDSLFSDFKTAVKALGAACLYSGKGKSSKAAIEKTLREHFDWTEEYDPFTEEDPLLIIYLSDWDYDGEKVIGPTFGEQALRYTPHIREARIGINPINIDNKEDVWYLIKLSNKAYREWADDKAYYLAECPSCKSAYVARSIEVQCPKCKIDLKVYQDEPHGFEVEALSTRTYYRLAVQALLRILDFDYLIERLRWECVADPYTASYSIFNQVAQNNLNYQTLLEEIRRLESIRLEFEERVREDFEAKGEPHISDWEHLQPNPEPEDFERHLINANPDSYAWRPFSRSLRTRALIDYLQETYSNDIEDYTAEDFDY